VKATQERRRKPRAPLDSDAIIKIGNDRLACRTLDVAVRGIALTGTMHSKPGDRMQVEFKLPNQRDWISVNGVLVRGEQRRGRPVWGIEFQNINHRTVGQIERYVREFLVGEARERYQRRQANVVQPRLTRPPRNPVVPPRKKPAPQKKSGPKSQYAIENNDLKKIFKAAIDDLEK